MSAFEPRPLVHLELHTGALQEACRFYAGLCGWRQEFIHTAAGSYLALDIGGEVGGGMVQCPTRRPLWLPYVEVHDVAETTDRARLLGARVTLPPREGPVGWRAVVTTPAAGELALWQPKR